MRECHGARPPSVIADARVKLGSSGPMLAIATLRGRPERGAPHPMRDLRTTPALRDSDWRLLLRQVA
jgi:hypothetical protein